MDRRLSFSIPLSPSSGPSPLQRADTLMTSQRLYRVEVFTDQFRLEGKLEPRGEIISAMNDKQRQFLPVCDATLVPLSAYSQLGIIAVPEMVVNKAEIVFLSLLDPADYADIRLLTNIARMTMYTSSFAVQAEFHIGGEIRQRDVLDLVSAEFMPITNAHFFALAPTKAAVPASRPFALLNKSHVVMFHGEKK